VGEVLWFRDQFGIAVCEEDRVFGRAFNFERTWLLGSVPSVLGAAGVGCTDTGAIIGMPVLKALSDFGWSGFGVRNVS
jgi:hypothetical protein